MSVEARFISQSSNGKKAQVVLLVGEGAHRRSITRHVHLEGGRWMGLNPDEAAVAQLDAGEKELEETQSCHETIASLAEIQMKDLKRFAGKIQQYREETHGVPATVFNLGMDILLAEQKLNAKTLKAALKAEIAKSEKNLKEIHGRVEKLRREIPRHVEFYF